VSIYPKNDFAFGGCCGYRQLVLIKPIEQGRDEFVKEKT
jgi:hypothetical protein